ncbi:MAG: hypothetical protein AB7F98_11575 [Novosphingobium sp.]
MPSLFRLPPRSKLDGAMLVSIAAMSAFSLFALCQQLPLALLA